MTEAKGGDPHRLGELRAMIDAIDESVHRLLIQRATVIDELIEVKGTAKSGAAFRPGREADMMRRLAARHTGNLPLGAVEHLWREIISTFTALQAPFTVSVGADGDPVGAVETARFTFGFTVPLKVENRAADVVSWLEDGGTDKLGLVLLDRAATAWWNGLEQAQVVARLPFLQRSGNRVRALVLAPPLADPVPFEVGCYAVRGKVPAELPGVETLASANGSILVAARDAALLEDAGLDIRAVGGYAAPLRVDG
ncbi:chorismate mutase [Aureimonas leprariae]|uniref:chorismate mutase n=1 Tax=Plantimonas leprariae TaxID=2615207 RepID=A0A7V7PL76_9HYPH|nr:chorismate mutase [Aureimonas leprariae]KAB0677035.1 chorismate mutase [Aureimonas leprariae]